MSSVLRHLSVRVPWHDTDWTGRVCNAPSANGSCLALNRIREDRIDLVEDEHAGKDWDVLGSNLPACVRERVSFMRDREFVVSVPHPYTSGTSGAHGELKPVPLRFPKYSAPCIPFRWMRREEGEEIAAQEGIDYRVELEDEADKLIGFDSGWIQHGNNQKAMLDGFFAAVQPPALVFFYAKRVPLTEDEGRVLIGVARVQHIAAPQLYPGKNPLGTFAWECMVQHSLRPDHGDGFLLPYHQALAATEADQSLDPGQFVAFAPEEARDQFSYVSEWVSHDAAITSLVSLERALRVAEEHLPVRRDKELQWLSERLGELWELRGPCPGLGSALHAFGVDQSTFVVRQLEPLIPENEDPWEIIERAMEDPHQLLPGLQQHIGINLRRKWKVLGDERRGLLKLVSRFALSPEQAERWYQPDSRKSAGIDCADADILANPYLLYEQDRYTPDPIAVRTVDHGAYPAESVQAAHPLPSPSAMEDSLDVRRVRALMVSQLEQAAVAGDTLLSASRVIERVRNFELDPPCRIDQDQLLVYGENLQPVIQKSQLSGGAKAFQLDRLVEVRQVIQPFVEKRRSAERHVSKIEWRPRLDGALGEVAPGDRDEERARTEKVAALEELFASRMSVLIGPAGTGKTTLLKVLCDEPSVAGGNVLLLAPTGKARVRLSSALGRDAQTIAQFLLKSARYVPETGQYRLSASPAENAYRTVIIDEASMLTEEQLAAVINGLKGVARFVLVGDPRQLPPIGAGRPFVDIVSLLRPDDLDAKFPRRAPCCGELTVPRRTTRVDGVETNQAERRADLMLAEWFGGRDPSPGADEIWGRLAGGVVDDTLHVVRWDAAVDLRERLLEVLVEELELSSEDDTLGFERACGGSEYEGHIDFWRKRGDEPGAAATIEDWQILAPVRGLPHGVRELNRFLQRHFRAATIERAKEISRYRKIPKPLGIEELLWGDKVISVVNESWRHVWPKEGALRYIANGDIGVVVGQYKIKSMKGLPWKGEVEFAGQSGYVYDYRPSDFGDEGSPPLELAYALTIHKAQGSEFGRTIVVIPNPCRILTRELLYTALTRQQARVTLLYQGDPAELKSFAEPERSETAVRLTNLFSEPNLIETRPGTFLEKGLIHTTSRGDVVRSKSEVVIAELLNARQVEYAYERKLTFDDGSFRYPDFTIEDDDLGRTIYWEHLGMLNDSVYAKRWLAKRKWYANHGVVEHPSSGKEILVSTEDDAVGGINTQRIAQLIEDLFG
jgi:ATP-dependent exoDNAse (exonuclease V) alpha subunit